MNKNESIIQYQVYRMHNFGTVLNNIHTNSYGGSEVDALYITKSNKAYFYEIKCSKSDFKADLKKPRHQLLLNRSDRISLKPKYFIYLCYGFVPDLSEIPEYAGCYLVDNNFAIKRYNGEALKKPPSLWKEDLTALNLLFINKKLLYRYLQLCHKEGRIEYQRL